MGEHTGNPFAPLAGVETDAIYTQRVKVLPSDPGIDGHNFRVLEEARQAWQDEAAHHAIISQAFDKVTQEQEADFEQLKQYAIGANQRIEDKAALKLLNTWDGGNWDKSTYEKALQDGKKDKAKEYFVATLRLRAAALTMLKKDYFEFLRNDVERLASDIVGKPKQEKPQAAQSPPHNAVAEMTATMHTLRQCALGEKPIDDDAVALLDKMTSGTFLPAQKRFCTNIIEAGDTQLAHDYLTAVTRHRMAEITSLSGEMIKPLHEKLVFLREAGVALLKLANAQRRKGKPQSDT